MAFGLKDTADITTDKNAGSASKLEIARNIGITGGVTGTPTLFDGSSDISIPVTAIDESKLSSAVAVERGGTGATTAAGALTNLGLTATATELNYCDGVTSAIQTQLNGKAPTSHASTTTTYGVSNATNYGHAMASSTSPLVAGTAALGSETSKFARGDHVHPAQTSVSGNAGSATVLETARTIGLSGGATGTATEFDGSESITIPVTALDESKLSSAVAVARGGTGATTAAGALTNFGLTATATELNYCDGVTSNIQTQLNGKEASITKNTAFNKNFETTDSNIKVAGTASVGELSTIARADHVHPAQTSVSGNAGTATKLAVSKTIGISGGATGTATAFDGSDNITIPVTALDESKLSSAVAIARGGTGATTAADALSNLGLTATATELNYCDGVTSNIQTQLNGKEPTFTKNDAFNKSFGTASGTVCEGNDSRLTDARTPSAHASTHGNSGSDKITIDASQTTTGVFDLARIPAGAKERLVTVANDTARFALTTDDVQDGDSVYVTATEKMYIVIDDSNLSTEAGYMQYRAYVSWDSIDNKPSSFTPSTHASTHATDGTDAITPASIGAEPSFTKNGAFNKDFGTASGTVCQGNDSRLSDSRTPTAHASTATTYGASSATNYGHAMASSTTPIVAGTAAVGSETAKFARGDHVHPAQTSVSGNAGTATKLAASKTIGISGGATGTATAFDGSDNITIPVTALDESKLSSAVAVARGGTGATTAAGALTNLGLTATATELNYCDGVTSNIQTQLDGKQDTITTLAIANGGTGATTAADALTNLGLTATATELNYCDGVTSNIQTQINNKQDILAAGTSGNVVTYTGTAGSIGSKGVDTTATASSSNLITSGAVYNLPTILSGTSEPTSSQGKNGDIYIYYSA